MQNNYTFLTDHSYSLRPDANDNNSIKKSLSGKKSKKSPRSNIQTKKIKTNSNRTVSIDRSSSDKENNSIVLPTSGRTSNKKSTGSRLSTRTEMTSSRTIGNKKSDSKTSSTKINAGRIQKKKSAVNRQPNKSSNNNHGRKILESNEVPLLLSIEERVKLRRTTPISSSVNRNANTKATPKKSTPVQDDLKQIRQSLKNISTKTPTEPSVKTGPTNVRTKKYFLGSGLDLDNIVLGNRHRRGVQT